MRINTNVAALNAYRNLSDTNNAVSSSMQKLSSGFRINRAADDAAGLGIANKLRGDIRAMSQAGRNTEQANSVLQIAEGATSSIQQMLERMKELATQAGSDSVDASGRGRINSEFTALRNEITRTVATTKFQGSALLNGTFGEAGASLASSDISGLSASAAGGTYNLAVDSSSGALTVTGPGSFSQTVNLADATFAGGKLSFDVTGLGTISVAAKSATDVAGVVTGLDSRGFGVTAASTGSSAAGATATGAASATAGNYSAASKSFTIAVDGGAAQTITLDGNYADVDAMATAINTKLSAAGISGVTVAQGTGADVGKLVWSDSGAGSANSFTVVDTDSVLGGNTSASGTDAAGATVTSASTVTAFAFGTTSQTFTVAVDGGTADTITLDADYGDMATMITAINTKLAASTNATTVTVEEGTGVNAGKLVWKDSGSGSTNSIDITDTANAVGGTVSGQGTDAAAASSVTSSSTATAADYSAINSKSFTIALDGGSAQTITLDGNYADVDAMATAINTKLSAAGINNVTVAQGTGADVGKLVWSDSDTGSTNSFAITDTNNVLGGNIATVSGTDAVAPASVSITADSITGNPAGEQASFLVGASGAYDTDDLLKLDAINMSVASLGIDTADLSTAEGARTALTSIDGAMESVSKTLGDIGASQNRIGYAMSNLKSSIQNFTAAESVIRDLDMAEEMTKFSKNNILAQAGTAMLAQANQSAQGVLQLLRG